MTVIHPEGIFTGNKEWKDFDLSSELSNQFRFENVTALLGMRAEKLVPD